MPLISLFQACFYLLTSLKWYHWGDQWPYHWINGTFSSLATCALSTQHSWPSSNTWILRVFSLNSSYLTGCFWVWFADPFFPRLFLHIESFWGWILGHLINYWWFKFSSNTGPALETEWPTWHLFPFLCAPRALQTHFVNFWSVSPQMWS